MKTVVGLFDDFTDVEKAVRELIDQGFSKNDISVIAHEKHSDKVEDLGVRRTPETGTRAAEGLPPRRR